MLNIRPLWKADELKRFGHGDRLALRDKKHAFVRIVGADAEIIPFALSGLDTLKTSAAATAALNAFVVQTVGNTL